MQLDVTRDSSAFFFVNDIYIYIYMLGSIIRMPAESSTNEKTNAIVFYQR